MEPITRTIYGNTVQTNLLLGLPHTFPAHSTLNEKFGINSSVLPTSTDNPKLGYFAIGIGGHTFTVGADNVPLPKALQHRSTDAALFSHLPFVLRLPANDLTATERAKYALRKQVVYNNTTYIAYYLKRLDLTAVAAVMQYVSVSSTGVETVTEFVPNSSNLNPTPPTITNSGTNTVTSDYVTANALVTVLMSEDDAAELINVTKIIYNDENYALISEIALCTGVDKVVSVTSSGSTFNMNEAIGVQVASHVPSFYSLYNANTGVSVTMKVGAAEPLYAITT